jgi:hypothetical protein
MEKANNITISDTLRFVVERCKEHNPDNRLSYEEVMCVLLVLRKMLEPGVKGEVCEPL